MYICMSVYLKQGVKRERAPFVFTHTMKAVMRPDQFDAFVDLCCDIYNILRDNSILLVSLISLAIPCNLPELQVCVHAMSCFL